MTFRTVICPPSSAAGSEGEGGIKMGTDVERMLRHYAAAWSSGDVEKVASFLTDDCVMENLGGGTVYRGKEGVKGFARDTFATIPDYKVEIKSLFLAGDWVSVEWIQSGTYTGEVGGKEVADKKFSGRGASIIELREGKIRREALYWDTLSFRRQLGVVPEAASG
jgi:steroid delta-isomerase-like uncharacterized protein